MPSPLSKVFDFKKQELPVVALLFSFFFLVIVVFQMLKPLKNGLFVERFGADVELYAKLLNIVVAAAGVAVFTYLYNRLPRQRLIYALAAFFIVGFVWLSAILRTPGTTSVWVFYLLGDLESTMMVASFFAYLTDISDADQAKRLYGVIGGGGVIGGWVGITFAAVMLDQIGMQGLLLLAAAVMGVVIVVTYSVERLVARDDVYRNAAGTRPVMTESTQEPSRFGAAIEGARLVMRSRYLAAIVGILAFYEIASQLMDYQFKHAVQGLSGVTTTQAYLADVYFFANLLSVVVQLFLVSLIMRKLGLVAALVILPVAILGGSIGFFLVPTMYVASSLVISENGLNYSLQQTSRESLYVVTTPEEKYKARAFTNMFVQRFAKGVSILALLGLVAVQVEVRYISLITIGVMGVMILCSVHAGRRFESMAGGNGLPTDETDGDVIETGKASCTDVQTATPAFPSR